ncbi:hypothetical protein LZ30DRAFT_77047 [Colletotrichum cereale]|nr:hypothetical protein LZ30DRAFT_77047 [Colletotrichum cereale]
MAASRMAGAARSLKTPRRQVVVASQARMLSGGGNGSNRSNERSCLLQVGGVCCPNLHSASGGCYFNHPCQCLAGAMLVVECSSKSSDFTFSGGPPSGRAHSFSWSHLVQAASLPSFHACYVVTPRTTLGISLCKRAFAKHKQTRDTTPD